MNDIVGRQDMTDLRSELRESFSDITVLLRAFMLRVDERFNQVETEQAKSRTEITKALSYLDSLLKKQEIDVEFRCQLHIDPSSA